MKFKIYALIALSILVINSKAQDNKNVYKTETLRIDKLTANSFMHISYLNTESYGRVPCNGMVVIDNGEAVVFDTPGDDTASMELITWIEKRANCQIKAVVITHFHGDCLGGIKEFHKRNIPSYANKSTIDLAKSDKVTLPQNGFDSYLEIKVGNKKVINEHLGEGHTKDNIVGYFPSEKVLFGGCLIKANGAGKGYLGDANVNDWSKTVEKVKTKYSDATIIIPGHGKAGGQELLDYTIAMFKN
ncbi:subclass B1 metallo-beta-lactamase [Fulvivirgaceae bacterium BMA12]|uniref:beta-lactamase n=1 Tax=Agaribacillus aureus TaxID=3051825 RepID=A0ABT8LCP1_9BACT|nr:subclass B1 metallo-beta-lactamase [Fulvivirgaceae bacterium BMA12]